VQVENLNFKVPCKKGINYMLTWLEVNWFSLIPIIAFAAERLFAFIQWHKSIQLRRSEFIHQIIEKLRFNEEMVKRCIFSK
jgi:hypothetical protein